VAAALIGAKLAHGSGEMAAWLAAGSVKGADMRRLAGQNRMASMTAKRAGRNKARHNRGAQHLWRIK